MHASFIASQQSSRKEVRTYYYTMYLPSVTYPLGNSFLMKNKLEKIEKQPISQILSKCGINNGPRDLGGHLF